MTPILSLFTSPVYLEPFTSWLGWVGWFLTLGLTIVGGIRGRGLQRTRKDRWWLILLFVLLIPLTNLFLGVRLPAGAALPEPGIPSGPHNPALMIFSALPWMLAGGFLGPVDALLVGLLTGLTRGLWDTHNLFSILEPALLAIIFSSAVRQRFRTLFYRGLRQPLLVGLGLVPVYALIFISSAFFSVSDAVPVRLDFALTNVGPAALAALGELGAAGLFVQVIAIALPHAWGSQETLQPSPSERSLQVRFLIGVGTFVSLLIILLILGDWVVAGNAARRMIRDRLASTALATAEIVPFYLETGQNLIAQLAADPRLLSESGNSLTSILGAEIRVVPYFDQLIVIDLQGDLVGAYPRITPDEFGLLPQEFAGVSLAVQGVVAQTYTIPPSSGSLTARVSFMSVILDVDGIPQRILMGRSELANNPLTQALINSLRSLESQAGEGLLLDDQGLILYSSNPDSLMDLYTGERGPNTRFSDLPAPNGTRNLVYYHPVMGSSWAVVLIVPAAQAQQLALDIAGPLTLLVLVLALAALVSLRVTLRVLTSSLQNLAMEAGRISQGQLDHPLDLEGVDEVGQLRRAFEQMRTSLHARLEELNQLLLVSQGVASTLEMETAVQPILEAVLATGASAVRVVLNPTNQHEEHPHPFALGPASETYAGLDASILVQVRKQGRLVLNNSSHWRGFGIPKGQPRPAALLAVAMYHEEKYHGVLWAAFNEPHSFTEQNVSFIATLAGHAALAAANAHLFRTAEVGRQRLAAILDSTPDPVLVTDQENRLILANPAARQALGFPPGSAEGQSTESVIDQKELRDLLDALDSGKQSAEIVLADGKIYFATASAVIADGSPVGRVCVLRDVTHFKELDALKTDFISTVGHDLRSPLTLMRGYATMLDMIGDLNEKQENYVKKIITGVESMSRLVNNLLDLGRIEAGVGLQVEEVVVMDILDAAMDTLRMQAEQKRIRLGVDVACDLAQMIAADRTLLQQAIYNLVENAIKYTPTNGSVSLRVKLLSSALRFEVQDTGIGIAPADQPRLFEKFFRGSQREARAQRGSGLGLAIVRSIAEQHGGKLWVESVLGQGSTFYLLIPLEQPLGRRKQKHRSR